ncbi:LPXTG cell wall anchor domain-containing protein [Salinibacterium sp. ZJ450]|uniref:LPXTG cell wall anchor domain-containing protein n=1 Tax=Salinibacterium sp. ZJ450 TaxID=2708338 RepID=UPI00141E6CE5|nr:LPXTG cell wall anchor domain-containing protein [Salinibacterium sp. ZJ450]
MKRIDKRTLGRAVAMGLGLAMIGGATLAVTAPAMAADPAFGYNVPEVYASDIAPNEDLYTGWHQGYANAADSFEVTAEGLVLTGESQVIYGYAEGHRITADWLLKEDVSAGRISWTTTAGSDPAYFQIPMFFGADTVTPKFTTLRPEAPVAGTNTATLDQNWVTSGDINDSYGSDAIAPLGDLLDAIIAEQNAQVIGFGVLSQDGTESVVTSLSWHYATYTFLPGTRIEAGTVAVTGAAAVGSVLTAVPAGWPADTSFSYQWIGATDRMGGPIDGATGSTYTVTANDIGFRLMVEITGTKPGHGPGTALSAPTTAVPAVAKAVGAPPVADSTGLAAFLASKGSTPQNQTAAGLPAGSLDPSKPYTATLPWAEGSDAFVDVYLYSSPVVVGAFPIVNGVAQMTLSAAVLSKLSEGSHTLVAVGQTSGSVQSVALSIAAILPATGPSAALPLSAGALLLLLTGGALFMVGRRKHA